MSRKQAGPDKRTKIENKNRDRRGGFSLVEMLATMLILLMVSSIVAAGIPSAVQVYKKVTRTANAEMLLSTSVSVLRDQLGTASDITVSADNTITYLSDDTNCYSKIYLNPSGSADSHLNSLMLQEYILPEAITGESAGDGAGTGTGGETNTDYIRPLVSNAAATKDLYITYGSVSYTSNPINPIEKGIVKIENLRVCLKTSDYSSEGDTLTSIDTLYIRPFGNMPTN